MLHASKNSFFRTGKEKLDGTRQAGRHFPRPSQEGSGSRQGLSRPGQQQLPHRAGEGREGAYRDRRNKKRDFRGLWIQRINAAARMHGLPYSQFMDGIKKAGIDIDRKVLSDIATREPDVFKSLVEQAQAALASNG